MSDARCQIPDRENHSPLGERLQETGDWSLETGSVLRDDLTAEQIDDEPRRVDRC